MISLDNLPKPFFILAPMDDVTDTVFRQIIADCSKPDLFFTEFVNVDGLQSPGRNKLLKKLRFAKKDQPLVAQLWGRDPQNFYLTARQIADGTFAREMGLGDEANFAGVDLNMGCPQKSEVNSGTCSALINDRPLAQSIISATKEGLDNNLPMSVKTRTGFNEIDLTWIEFLLKQDLNMLSVHGRTRRDKSKYPAKWDVIGQAREIRDKLAPQTLIVGNGDVMSRQQGIELAKKYQLDGIMIGRGIFQDPFVFSEQSPWAEYTRHQKIELYKAQVQLFIDTWQDKDRPIHTLNKFCKVYINDFDGAKEIRERLMNAKSADDLDTLLNNLSGGLLSSI
jgi:tRNA-dihydrouridine synthase